ncbi:MAG TPA: anti-sigma factor [Anaerolineaceae bacterium]|nr:anti-sigma factor [Anaerolineaceae bacterium]HOQ68521.1 anti-sigma factor [Anaerolineaceae bacterium]
MSKRGHCKEHLRQFSDYIDGELAPDICAQLEAHLQECKDCQVVMNTLQKTIDLYQVAEGEETLPEGVRSRLFARLQIAQSTGKKPGE